MFVMFWSQPLGNSADCLQAYWPNSSKFAKITISLERFVFFSKLPGFFYKTGSGSPSPASWGMLSETIACSIPMSFSVPNSVSCSGYLLRTFCRGALSLMAVEYAKAGIASTLMALTPVLIIVPYSLINTQKIKLQEVIGTLVTVSGVAMFFLL